MKFYTPKELAELLQISEETLYRLRRAGHIGYLKLAGRGSGVVRFTEDHVTAFVASCEREATRAERNDGPSRLGAATRAGRTMARIVAIDDEIKRAKAAGDSMKVGVLTARRAEMRAQLRQPRGR